MSEAAPSFGSSYSDTAMHDGTTANDDIFDNVEFTVDEEPIPDESDDDNPYDSFLSADEPEIDASFIKAPVRPRNARAYEKKVQGLFALGVKLTIANPRTMADSAAMLLYGPQIAEKAGDLAASSTRAAAIIDAITDQTENPTTALIVATAPLILQVMRNHEPQVEREWRGIPLGRGRRIKFRIPFKLGKRMRNVTSDPKELTFKVLSNDNIAAALRKQGINIVSE